MAVSGTNLEQIGAYNRRVVIETVRLSGSTSRAEIARATGLSAQTVSNIADELIRAGIVTETGRRRSARGQPPVDLAINPDGGFTVGLSLDHRRLVAVSIDLAGDRRGELDIAIDEPTPATAFPAMVAAVDRLRRAVPDGRRRTLGVGVVMPALFEQGSLISFGPSSVPAWEGFPLIERLSARLGLPVLVENDATAAAIAERLYGAGRDLRDFLYVYVGVGLGSGLVIAGQPYRGATGKAGELGHVVVVPGGRPCLCGNRGCLERYVSFAAAQEAVGGGVGAAAIDPLSLSRMFAAGDLALRRWLVEAAAHLRQALASVENLLDPEAIVIGGLLPPAMLQALIAALDPLPPSVSARPGRTTPRILPAALGQETPALGAAALPLFDRLSPSLDLLLKAVRAAQPAA